MRCPKRSAKKPVLGIPERAGLLDSIRRPAGGPHCLKGEKYHHGKDPRKTAHVARKKPANGETEKGMRASWPPPGPRLREEVTDKEQKDAAPGKKDGFFAHGKARTPFNSRAPTSRGNLGPVKEKDGGRPGGKARPQERTRPMPGGDLEALRARNLSPVPGKNHEGAENADAEREGDQKRTNEKGTSSAAREKTSWLRRRKPKSAQKQRIAASKLVRRPGLH